MCSLTSGEVTLGDFFEDFEDAEDFLWRVAEVDRGRAGVRCRTVGVRCLSCDESCLRHEKQIDRGRALDVAASSKLARDVQSRFDDMLMDYVNCADATSVWRSMAKVRT